LFPVLRSVNSGRILDAGCGYGLWSFYMARNFPSFEITGIDVQEDAIEFCNLVKEEQSLDNVQFHKLAFDELTYQNQFNILLSLFSLHYSYYNDVEILKLFVRALIPGGILILTVPIANSIKPRTTDHPSLEVNTNSKYGIHVNIDDFLDHYYPNELSKKLTQAGFTWYKIYPIVGGIGVLAKSIYARTSNNTLLHTSSWPIAFSLGWLDSLLPHYEGWFLLALASTSKK
jgi:SAM-dependent methyltransferase